MRIDSHQHFWKYHPVKNSWIDGSMSKIRRDFGPEDLLPELDHAQIDACIAVQADESSEETRFLLEMANQNPWITKVVGWVDLCAADIEQQLEKYSQEPRLAGFRRVLQSLPPEAMEEKSFLSGVSHLEKFGFTYDILIFPKHLKKAYQFAKKFPNQTFVVDHIAKPDIRNSGFGFWSKGIENLAELPNVSCKVSGMVTEADWGKWDFGDFVPYLDFVTEKFGVDRLLYGSDWPVCLLAGSYQQVHQLASAYFQHFSESEKRAIFGENAAGIYHIV